MQGTVVVEATLDAKGMVSDARVVSGPPELRKPALESVLQWHFTQDAAESVRQIGVTFQTPPEGALTSGVGFGIQGGIQGGVTGGVTGGVGGAPKIVLKNLQPSSRHGPGDNFWKSNSGSRRLYSGR